MVCRAYQKIVRFKLSLTILTDYASIYTVMTSTTRENKQSINVLSSIAESRAGKYALIVVAAAAGFVALKSISERHAPAVTSMAELRNNLGHIPSGVEAITQVENSDLEVVDYTVQPKKTSVGAIDSDIHAVAPAQISSEETQMVDTYLTKAQAKAQTAPSLKHIKFYVNTKTAEVIPNPKK